MSTDPEKKGEVVQETVPTAYERPKGWRGVYSHPTTQIVMLGFVCFMGPGLFNASAGLGAGGQADSQSSANGAAALYSTFAIMAFFAGTINNKLGSRTTLFLGTLGYPLYIGSLLATIIHTDAGAFVIAAGAILGICAGLLWTAQGSLMLAYPTEAEKGRSIAIFWGIFNLGGVVGGAVALGENFHSEGRQVGQGTYIGFIVLTIIGSLIPFVMASPEQVYRTDGSKVTTPRHPSWKTEIYSLYVALRTDPLIILLLPMFWASNWFYTWQFNNYNGQLFNIRTRALNSFVYWLSQIFGSLGISLLLDSKLTRKTRALAGWGVLLVMTFIVHGWAYHYQRDYVREVTEAPGYVQMDFTAEGFAGYIWLYIFCGLLDAMWQTASYWLFGAMSNDPAKLAHFTGLYKSIQSAGGAVSWRIDATKTPFMNIFVSTWVLLAVGLAGALPMIFLRVKEHTELEDEVLVRMDDQGVILDVAEIKAREPGGGEAPGSIHEDSEKDKN